MKCLSPASSRRDALRRSRLAGGIFFAAWLCAAVTGCARDAVGPADVAAFRAASPTRSITAQCPAAPDVVVSTEAELRTAVANAPAGSTIAINGMIAVSGGAIMIYQSDLRLTCATPGAGLEGNSAQRPGRLLRVHAPGVSVMGLRLDGQNANIEPVLVASVLGGTTAEDVTLADNDMTCSASRCATFSGTPRAIIVRNRMAPASGVTTGAAVRVESQIGGATAEDVTFADNSITCASGTCAWFLGTSRAVIARNHMAIAAGGTTSYTITVQRIAASATNLEYGAEDVTVADNDIACGSGSCVFSIGTPRALITRNRLLATASGSGIHVQGSSGVTDGTRVEQNTVTATAPSTNSLFGGIRVRDGEGIVVANNLVTGPWQNSVIITSVLGGEVSRNELRDAIRFGILFGSNNIPAVRPLVDGLTVRNNRVTDAGGGAGVQFSCRNVFVGNNLNGNSVGAEFFAESGANTLVGNGTIVVDNGAMDCDGDGKVDPNVITGAKRSLKGLPVGPVIGSAVSGAVSDMR